VADHTPAEPYSTTSTIRGRLCAPVASKLALLLFLLIAPFSVAACGEGEQEGANETTTRSAVATTETAGEERVVSQKFQPRVELPLGDLDVVTTTDAPDLFNLLLTGDSLITFANGAVKFVDRESPHTSVDDIKIADIPNTRDAIVPWFQGHPCLEATDPSNVTVAGKKGVAFDVAVAKGKGYRNPDRLCAGVRCVLLWESCGGGYTVPEPSQVRVIVVDAGREPVTIYVEAPKTDFVEFVEKVDDLLNEATIGGSR
jgi:hypothetical protein